MISRNKAGDRAVRPGRACRILALTGCTATGKSAVAQQIARREGLAILSADAMQVYQGLDIGTAKLPPAARAGVVYYGLDRVAPGVSFSAGDWLKVARAACRAAASSGRPLVVVGGTGLYFQALLCGLDAPAPDARRRAAWQAIHAREGVEGLRRRLADRAPEALAALSDDHNPRRLIRALECTESDPAWMPACACPSAGLVALHMPRDRLRSRIAQRVDDMLAAGWIEEVAQLRRRVAPGAATAWQAIGYRELAAVLDGTRSLATARAETIVRTARYAKRQQTWFRHRMQPAWVDVSADASIDALADRVLEAWNALPPCWIHMECDATPDPGDV